MLICLLNRQGYDGNKLRRTASSSHTFSGQITGVFKRQVCRMYIWVSGLLAYYRGLLGLLYHVRYKGIVLKCPLIIFNATCLWTKYLVRISSLKGCVKNSTAYFNTRSALAIVMPLRKWCGAFKAIPKTVYYKQTAVALTMHTLNLSLPVGSGDIATNCPLDDLCNQLSRVKSSVSTNLLYPGILSFYLMRDGMNSRVVIANLSFTSLQFYYGPNSIIMPRTTHITWVHNKELCPPLEL